MANSGVSPVDLTTDVGQIRLLLGDTDANEAGEYLWFSDEELEALAGLYNGSVKRAAARALRIVAASHALILKKWSQNDQSVDGPAVAEALRQIAKDYEAEADSEEQTGAGFFELVPGQW